MMIGTGTPTPVTMFLPRPMRSQCTQPRHIVKTQRQRPKKVISENSPIASPSTNTIAHQSIDSHTPRLSDTQNAKSRRKPLILSRPSKLYDPEPLYSVRFLPLQPARASTTCHRTEAHDLGNHYHHYDCLLQQIQRLFLAL